MMGASFTFIILCLLFISCMHPPLAARHLKLRFSSYQGLFPVIHSEMWMCLSLCQACGHVSSPEKYLEAKYGHSHFYNSWTMAKKSCMQDYLNNLMSHLIEMSMEGCSSRIPGHMCRGVRMVSDTSTLTFHCRIFNDYFALLKLFRLFWMDLNEHTKPVLWSQPGSPAIESELF